MSRFLTIAGAQLGPIQKTETREAVVQRMLALMDQAKSRGHRVHRLSGVGAHDIFPALVSRG